MEKEYEIKHEPTISDDIKNSEGEIVQKGVFKEKYNIYYYENGQPAMLVPYKEFHSIDGINGIIREGYTQKQSN